MHLVLDTNIVMDMLHFDNPFTRPLGEALREKRVRCYTDADCLAELERVTGYPEFRLDSAGRRALLEQYTRLATRCDGGLPENILLPRCRDRDDQKFLILAARCHADLLITRDKLLLRLMRNRHHPPPCPIVTAKDWCQA